MSKTILITGVAGFIGYSLAEYLLKNTSFTIVGLDNVNDYYDVRLKEARLNNLSDRVRFYKRDLNDDLSDIFSEYNFDSVINLAAQAGVRYSKANPETYIHSNVDGFFNLMRTSQMYGVKKVIYASSSSVYGSNKEMPFSEDHQTATPMSLYAATKLANESIASGFFYSYGIRTVGLRFFNIYGPYGRPDMAYFKWADNILNSRDVELNNNGEMWRDMTYIGDCVKVIAEFIDDESTENIPEVYNVGSTSPVKIADLLNFIASELSIKPAVRITEAGSEEPLKTWASTDRLTAKIGFAPDTDFHIGIKEFLIWYKNFYD